MLLLQNGSNGSCLLFQMQGAVLLAKGDCSALILSLALAPSQARCTMP